MISDDPGPGQKYAIMARKHIATLRDRKPEVWIETRWYPSRRCVEGNEIVDEWAKPAADGLDAHGVEWLSFKDPHGRVRQRRFPWTTSNAASRRRGGKRYRAW